MTTQIKITHEGPSKHEARVRQMSGGTEIGRTVLMPGESVVLNVYTNHEINVQEGREIEHVAPAAPNAETRAAIDDSIAGRVESVESVDALVAVTEGVELGDSAEVVHAPGLATDAHGDDASSSGFAGEQA